jgi:hypothetical protein
MQDCGHGLPRIPLLRTRVNKGDSHKVLTPMRRTGVRGGLQSFRLRTSDLIGSSLLLLVHAGVGLATLGGVAILGSAAPSSCFLCLRERCFGPATTTTTIAATTISPQ